MAQRKDIIIGGGSSLSERTGEYFSHKLLGAHRKVGCTIIALLVLTAAAIAVVVLVKGWGGARLNREKPDPAIEAAIAEHMQAGIEARRQMDLAKAERNFARVAELDPKNTKAWMALATTQLRQGNDEGALFSLLHRNKLTPEDAGAQFLAMDIYKRMGKNQEAFQAAREAVRLDQLNPLYTNTLYIMRIQNGELDKVSEELESMAALRTRNLEPTFIFGRAAVALAKGDEDAAVRYVLDSRRMVGPKVFIQLFYNDFFKPIVDRLTKAIPEMERPKPTEIIEQVLDTPNQPPDERQPRNDRRPPRQR